MVQRAGTAQQEGIWAAATCHEGSGSAGVKAGGTTLGLPDSAESIGSRRGQRQAGPGSTRNLEY